MRQSQRLYHSKNYKKGMQHNKPQNKTQSQIFFSCHFMPAGADFGVLEAALERLRLQQQRPAPC
jgi:hypothetical protein